MVVVELCFGFNGGGGGVGLIRVVYDKRENNRVCVCGGSVFLFRIDTTFVVFHGGGAGELAEGAEGRLCY